MKNIKTIITLSILFCIFASQLSYENIKKIPHLRYCHTCKSTTGLPLSFLRVFFIMENQEEIWKDIDGYEGLYQVSNIGRVRSLPRTVPDGGRRKGMIMKPHISNNYIHIGLYDRASKKNKSQIVHRLIAKTFIPNPLNKPQVNHINGIKHDNRVENLEWVTNAENMQHAFKTGLINNNGELGTKSKLTNNQVLKIREMASNGMKKCKIAIEFGVHEATIGQIVNRVIWKHI